MSELDDIRSSAESAHESLDEARASAKHAADEASDLEQRAADHGWDGVAQGMASANESLEAAASAVDAAMVATTEGVSQLAEITAEMSSDEVARRLAASGQRFSSARTTAAQAVNSLDNARTLAQQADALTLLQLLDHAEDNLDAGRDALEAAVTAATSEQSEATAWGKDHQSAVGASTSRPPQRGEDRPLPSSGGDVEGPAAKSHPAGEVSPQAAGIADHAHRRFDEGALDHHVKDVPVEDLGRYVDDVLEGRVAVESKYDADTGRAAHWDPEKEAIVIENGDGGTVFTPKEGRTYYDDIW
jgi:hypothetical protein